MRRPGPIVTGVLAGAIAGGLLLGVQQLSQPGPVTWVVESVQTSGRAGVPGQAQRHYATCVPADRYTADPDTTSPVWREVDITAEQAAALDSGAPCPNPNP